MNTIIVLNSEGVSISTAEEARAARDSLLLRVKECPLVTDADTHTTATNLLRDLRGFYKAIEVGRETAKAPVIRMGKEIDAFARDLSFAVYEHSKQLGTMLGAYDMEQRRKAELERQKAAAEEERIRKEAADKQKAVDDAKIAADKKAADALAAETARIKAEADAKAARARTPEGAQRAIAEAAKQIETVTQQAEIKAVERVEAAETKKDQVFETAVVATAQARSYVLATPAKPKDTSTRNKPCFEITDIVALYEAAPYLVNMTPNTAALNSAIKGLRGDQTLPGVKHWFEASTITRG